MYRNTRFGELMKGLSRPSFDKIVKEHKSDKYSKGFKSWDQLIAMIYTQVSGCRSLREVETGFNSQTLHHYHLGTRSIKRSTLSDANANRDSEVFAQLCGQLLDQMGRTVRNEIKDLLYLIDSTSITLKGLGFNDWTKENKNNHTQGIKVHIMTEQSQSIPIYVSITAANINDIEDGRKIPIEAGATYVFDKGYYDYNWWYRIHKRDAFFVSRFKHNAATNTIKAFNCGSDNSEDILEDSLVEFKN